MVKPGQQNTPDDARKADDAKKDGWDKFDVLAKVLSTFIASVVIAAVALYVNSQITTRQNEETNRQHDREYIVNRIKVLSEFVPLFAKGGAQRGAALYAIAALQMQDLANQLTNLYPKEKVTQARALIRSVPPDWILSQIIAGNTLLGKLNCNGKEFQDWLEEVDRWSATTARKFGDSFGQEQGLEFLNQQG